MIKHRRTRYWYTLGADSLRQYECSAFIIDTWVDSVAQGRSNYTPSRLPWEVMQVLIRESYGGKIDDEDDFRALDQLVTQILTPAAFESDHQLVQPQDVESGIRDPTKTNDNVTSKKSVEGLTVPEGTTMRDFVDWVNRLPEREPPVYLGLPANADRVLLVGQAQSTIRNLQYVAALLDEGETLMGEATEVV